MTTNSAKHINLKSALEMIRNDPDAVVSICVVSSKGTDYVSLNESFSNEYLKEVVSGEVAVAIEDLEESRELFFSNKNVQAQ